MNDVQREIFKREMTEKLKGVQIYDIFDGRLRLFSRMESCYASGQGGRRCLVTETCLFGCKFVLFTKRKTERWRCEDNIRFVRKLTPKQQEDYNNRLINFSQVVKIKGSSRRYKIKGIEKCKMSTSCENFNVCGGRLITLKTLRKKEVFAHSCYLDITLSELFMLEEGRIK